MIDYTMPVLSEKEKAYQIEMCESEIERLEITLKSGSSDTPHHVKSALVRQKIALAALTAKPVGYGLREDIQLMKSKKMMYGAMTVRFQGEEALFAAPPVPVKQEGEQCSKCKGNGWFADEMGMRRCFMCNDSVQEGEQ